MLNEGIFLLRSLQFVFSQTSYIKAYLMFGWGRYISRFICIIPEIFCNESTIRVDLYKP